MPAKTTKDRPAPLTETQHQVLGAAGGRPEGALILPARLKGKAALTLAQALLDKNLVREIRARAEMPVWRKDEDTGRIYSLVLTKAGRALVGAQVEADPTQPDGDLTQKAKTASPAPTPAADTTPTLAEPRSGSKLARVIVLLGRDGGSSVAELMSATGWLAHTTRAALTGLRKRGYPLTRQAGAEGSVYRIVQGSAPTATAPAAVAA